MSAFLVQPETINACVNAMLANHQSAEDGDKLGRELLWLNHRALHQRYGDELPAMEDIEFRFRNRPMLRPLAMLRALDCLIYQCSEGDCDEHDIYRNLEDCRDALCRKIARSIPEYETHVWG